MVNKKGTQMADEAGRPRAVAGEVGGVSGSAGLKQS